MYVPSNLFTDAGAVSKPVDDVKLNMKYTKVVCETCKLQIHEKLKRGYAKYKSLEKMKEWYVQFTSQNFRISSVHVQSHFPIVCTIKS